MIPILVNLALSLVLLWGAIAHATLFEYDYVGNNYSLAGAPYTTDMRVNVWMSGDHPNIFNFVGDISSFISDIKITDGVQEYSSVLGNFTIFDANLVTDGAGNIVEWEMGFLLIDPAGDPTEAIVTKSCGFNSNPALGCGSTTVIDHAEVNQGLGQFAEAIDTPGTWTTGGKGIAPIPEPSTLLLLASGLAGLAALRRRKAA